MTKFGHGPRVPKPVNRLVYSNDVRSQGELNEKTYLCVVVRCYLGRASLGPVFTRVFEGVCSNPIFGEGEVGRLIPRLATWSKTLAAAFTSCRTTGGNPHSW